MGSDAMLAKLSEALFVDTLRRYIAGLPNSKPDGSLERDPIVGKPRLLHSRIAHSVDDRESLEDGVGISRSALVKRFTRYLRATHEVLDLMEVSNWA